MMIGKHMLLKVILMVIRPVVSTFHSITLNCFRSYTFLPLKALILTQSIHERRGADGIRQNFERDDIAEFVIAQRLQEEILESHTEVW